MASPSATLCRGCGIALRVGSRFCAGCGLPAPAVEQEHRRAFHEWRRRTGAAAGALAWCFAGLFGVLALSGLALEDVDPLLRSALAYAVMAGVGVAATHRLGRGALRETFPWRCEPPMLALGVACGVVGFALAWGYVELLARAFDAPAPTETSLPLVAEILSVVVLPALVEEWLCRGVSWAALARLSGPGVTLVASAALFAILHGLEGWVFSFPHRFVLGLLLGWVRARSGSLLPAVLGHATNNLLAVCLP